MPLGPIDTPRLLIRPFAPADWVAVHAYAADAAVMAYLPGGPLTAAQARAFVAANVGEQARACAVILKADGRLIGHLLFHPWFAPRTYEVGWVLHPRQHGRGYATEAAMAVLQHGFEVLRLYRVIATCQPENVPSWRVMEKLGMRREGWFRQCIPRGEATWWDEWFYALLEEDWFTAAARARG
jgi:[ribosomal protein S5]-alanine N-acetyltransferase